MYIRRRNDAIRINVVYTILQNAYSVAPEVWKIHYYHALLVKNTKKKQTGNDILINDVNKNQRYGCQVVPVIEF